MGKRSRGAKALPPTMQALIRRLGENIQLARKKRRIPLREMSERTMVSVPTIRKVESGDPSVSLGIVAQILWVLQLHEGLELLADPRNDVMGMQKEKERLPKKIHTEKKKELDF